MYEIHRPHLKSGYIIKIRYQKTTDEKGSPDWFIYYTPGPRAKTEFQTFNGGKRILRPKRRQAIASSLPPAEKSSVHDELSTSPTAGKGTLDETTNSTTADQAKLITELTDRGVVQSVADKLIRSITPDQISHREHLP